MLRFARRPDPVFLTILHDALEDLQETLMDLETEDWPALYPLAARCFSPDYRRQAPQGQSGPGGLPVDRLPLAPPL